MVTYVSTTALASDSKSALQGNDGSVAITSESGSEVLANLKPVGGARTSTFEVTQNLVRLRKNPSLSGTVLGHLNKGDLVNAGTMDYADADGYTWVYVYSFTHKYYGWVAIDYLYEVG